MLQGVEEETIIIHTCSSCETDIYLGEYYYAVEHGLYERFYCGGCTNKRRAGEE